MDILKLFRFSFLAEVILTLAAGVLTLAAIGTTPSRNGFFTWLHGHFTKLNRVLYLAARDTFPSRRSSLSGCRGYSPGNVEDCRLSQPNPPTDKEGCLQI